MNSNFCRSNYLNLGMTERDFSIAVMKYCCDSQDLTLQAILSNGVATVRQTLRRMFSAMAAERAKKRRKLVLTPVNNNHRAPALRVMQRKAAQTSGRLECSYQDWAILFQVF